MANFNTHVYYQEVGADMTGVAVCYDPATRTLVQAVIKLNFPLDNTTQVWVFVRRPGDTPPKAPTHVIRQQYKGEGVAICPQGSDLRVSVNSHQAGGPPPPPKPMATVADAPDEWLQWIQETMEVEAMAAGRITALETTIIPGVFAPQADAFGEVYPPASHVLVELPPEPGPPLAPVEEVDPAGPPPRTDVRPVPARPTGPVPVPVPATTPQEPPGHGGK